MVLLAACFCTVADAEVLSDKNGRLYYSCQILLSAYEEITFKELDGGTYSYNDMEFTDYKLIFTKLDETTTLGNLFNLCMHTGASMSYVTCGQNVPDDIEVFSPQKVVKQLLGGK